MLPFRHFFAEAHIRLGEANNLRQYCLKKNRQEHGCAGVKMYSGALNDR